MRKIVPLLTILITLAGCTSPRQMSLFSSKLSSMDAPESPYFVIAPNDLLEIHVTATDGEAVALYASAGHFFVVNNEGTVNIPLIGRVKLSGMTTEEAKNFLTEKVREQVKDPIILLTINNATITILGEVNNPTRFAISGPIALPQAIGVVGGFTTNARLNNVLVQRCEKDRIIKYHVNLLTDDLFSSPCYYLQKGDVVDVQPLHLQ